MDQTAEHLTAATLGRSRSAANANSAETGDRSKSTFAEDQEVPAFFRATLKDYFRSGYDRGHMYYLLFFYRFTNFIDHSVGCQPPTPKAPK